MGRANVPLTAASKLGMFPTDHAKVTGHPGASMTEQTVNPLKTAAAFRRRPLVYWYGNANPDDQPHKGWRSCIARRSLVNHL